jgi:hypothetical protein
MITGFYEYNQTQREQGQPIVTVGEYFHTGHPWEATFETWESEFLQMAVFILMTTFLVQKGSPESRRPGAMESELRARPVSRARASGVEACRRWHGGCSVAHARWS